AAGRSDRRSRRVSERPAPFALPRIRPVPETTRAASSSLRLSVRRSRPRERSATRALLEEIVEVDDLGGVGLRAVRDQHRVDALVEGYAERAGDDLFALAIAQHEIVVAGRQVDARGRARSRQRE